MDGDVVDPAVAQSNRAALNDVQQEDAAKCVIVYFLAAIVYVSVSNPFHNL